MLLAAPTSAVLLLPPGACMLPGAATAQLLMWDTASLTAACWAGAAFMRLLCMTTSNQTVLLLL